MAEAAAHPTPKQYWIIALILAVVTAIEIAIPSIPALDPIKVPALLILGVIKFWIVVAFFMHLRYEPFTMNFMFYFGLVGAIALFIAVLLAFEALFDVF